MDVSEVGSILIDVGYQTWMKFEFLFRRNNFWMGERHLQFEDKNWLSVEVEGVSPIRVIFP